MLAGFSVPTSVVLLLGAGIAASSAADCSLPSGAVLRVALSAESASTAVRPSMTLGGTLHRPVYAGTCLALPQGSRIRAVVDRVEKPPVNPFISWMKWLAGKTAPPAITLRSAEAELPGHAPVPFNARFLRIVSERHSEASRKGSDRSASRRILLLETANPLTVAETPAGSRATSGGTIASGSRVRVDLVTPLSSASNQDGDTVRLRLAEPLRVDGNVILPEGAVFEAVVAQSRRARRPYRAGRLRLNFRTLLLPTGERLDAALTPSAGEFTNATKLDPEGGLTGGALDRKRALVNLALAYATGKVLDDLIEESAKAAIGASVAGSARTWARYAGLGAGTIVFLLHRGREVQMEPHTELELTFSRDLRVDPAAAPR